MTHQHTRRKFLAYSDECSITTGRYGSIAVLSMPQEVAPYVEERLVQILRESSIEELKWSEPSARMRFAAMKVLDLIIPLASQGRIRIDVLIIDKTDDRHNVHDRDDMLNFQKMYFHLLRHLIESRWVHNTEWYWFPHRLYGIKWKEIQDSINDKGVRVEVCSDQGLRFVSNFQIAIVEPSSGRENVCIQVTDLLAGVAYFSYTERAAFNKYLLEKDGQVTLAGQDIPSITPGKIEHCKILEYLLKICKSNGQSAQIIGLDKGLKTSNPSDGVNFWLYTPQHEKDKAPIKTKS